MFLKRIKPNCVVCTQFWIMYRKIISDAPLPTLGGPTWQQNMENVNGKFCQRRKLSEMQLEHCNVAQRSQCSTLFQFRPFSWSKEERERYGGGGEGVWGTLENLFKHQRECRLLKVWLQTSTMFGTHTHTWAHTSTFCICLQNVEILVSVPYTPHTLAMQRNQKINWKCNYI